MKDCTYIVVAWLDAEQILGVSQKAFAKQLRTEDWVAKRCKLFKAYTEKSLLNQGFQDFRIFLLCGSTFRYITSQFPFDPKVEVRYDYAKNALQEINTPYLNWTRIDSDDMFHKDVMLEVKENAKFTDQRETVVYRDLIQWNVLHNFVSDIKISRTPFASHTFPKAIYKNWVEFKKQQFMGYRSCLNVLTPRRVCIVRHDRNVTWPRIFKDPRSSRYLRDEMRKRNNIIKGAPQMFKVLKNFGVKKSQVK